MGIPESAEKMVAFADNSFLGSLGWIDNLNARFGNRAVYLCVVLD